MTVRNPVVAGAFYPASKNSLTREVEALIDSKAAREDAIGVVCPHAGYIYSGAVAGSVLSSIKPRKSYIIIGPNHTGLGSQIGLDTSSSWKTPLGDVLIDKPLAEAIKKHSHLVRDDSLSHAHEHSVEVQLPFLQVLQKDFTFVPLVISYAGLEEYRDVGRALAKAVKELKAEKEVTIIASSDMTHYESQESAKRKDFIAIDAILKLDEKRLLEVVAEYDISMCGYAPAAIMIVAAKELGATKANLVRYQTSGDASGDYSAVVGYAGIIVK
ncbi:MAG: AmmeMemoRadiSam system protein B [Candidatus Omnitrophica bacterium]|nr:AmmeMemoRadiSam system protein B [Candidatus Omnitrophota bacterium]